MESLNTALGPMPDDAMTIAKREIGTLKAFIVQRALALAVYGSVTIGNAKPIEVWSKARAALTMFAAQSFQRIVSKHMVRSCSSEEDGESTGTDELDVKAMLNNHQDTNEDALCGLVAGATGLTEHLASNKPLMPYRTHTVYTKLFEAITNTLVSTTTSVTLPAVVEMICIHVHGVFPASWLTMKARMAAHVKDSGALPPSVLGKFTSAKIAAAFLRCRTGYVVQCFLDLECVDIARCDVTLTKAIMKAKEFGIKVLCDTFAVADSTMFEIDAKSWCGYWSDLLQQLCHDGCAADKLAASAQSIVDKHIALTSSGSEQSDSLGSDDAADLAARTPVKVEAAPQELAADDDHGSGMLKMTDLVAAVSLSESAQGSPVHRTDFVVSLLQPTISVADWTLFKMEVERALYLLNRSSLMLPAAVVFDAAANGKKGAKKMYVTTDVAEAELPKIYYAGPIVVADDCPSAASALSICDLKWPNGTFTTVYVIDGTGGNVVNLPHVPAWLTGIGKSDSKSALELLREDHSITMPQWLHGVFGATVNVGCPISTFEFGTSTCFFVIFPSFNSKHSVLKCGYSRCDRCATPQGKLHHPGKYGTRVQRR